MTKKNNKTAAELLAENRLLRRFGVAQSESKVVVAIIKYGVVAFSVWKFAGMAVEIAGLWAGKVTIAQVKVGVDANVDVDATVKLLDALPLKWLVAAVLAALLVASWGIGYGLRQSRLRRETIAQLSWFREQYELLHDPNRSSSRLSITGDEPKSGGRTGKR